MDKQDMLSVLIEQERKVFVGFLVVLFSFGIFSGYMLSKDSYASFATLVFGFVGMGFGLDRLIRNIRVLEQQTKENLERDSQDYREGH